MRRAGRRLVAPVARRGVRATRRCAPTRRARRRWRRRSARRSRAATSCGRAGSSTPPVLVARASARSSSRGTGDSRSDRHDAAAADPRRHGALRARRCSAQLDVRGDVEVRVPGDVAARARVVRRRALVPARCRSARRRRAALPDLPRRRSRRTMPLVVTVHDLAVLRHPGVVQPLDAHLLAHRRAARSSRAATRVHRRLGVHEARARRAARRARGEDPTSCRTRSRTSSRPTGRAAEGDYVLAVGTLEPRKNLARDRGDAVDGRAARRRRARLGRRRAAARTSPGSATVADDELAALYRGARCLVYASLYEGFGIPVAEALACGCPVVTSRGSAMAEVAGDAAELRRPGGRRLDSRRASSGRRAARRARARVAHVGATSARRGRAARLRGGSCVIVARRRRARPPPHRRRDLRLEPAARAAARSRPTCGFAAVTRHPELVPDGRRADRAAGALAGAADGLVAAAARCAGCGRSSRTSSTRCRSARPDRGGRHAARPLLRARPERRWGCSTG